MYKIRLQHATEIRIIWYRNNTSLSWGEGETTKKARVLHKNGKNATSCISNVQHLLLTKDRAPTFYLR